jgi:hypothetical protein
MRASRSRSIVLLLDCCYGGAFGQGVAVRAAGDVNVLESFPGGRSGGGRGRAVITASSSMEYAFEGDRLADDQGAAPSVFTSALVEGLATGAADRDEDGWVSLNELYDYVFERVREQNSHQTPSKDVEMQGELYVARSGRRRVRPQPVPADLRAAMVNENMFSRIGAMTELRSRLAGSNLPMAAGAAEALREIAAADIQYVADAAATALRDAETRTEVRDLRFGTVPVGADAGTRTVGLLGPPLARACSVQPSEVWIRATLTEDGCVVSVDPSGPGVHRGSVTLRGPVSDAVLTVEVEAAAEAVHTDPPLIASKPAPDESADRPAAAGKPRPAAAGKPRPAAAEKPRPADQPGPADRHGLARYERIVAGAALAFLGVVLLAMRDDDSKVGVAVTMVLVYGLHWLFTACLPADAGGLPRRITEAVIGVAALVTVGWLIAVPLSNLAYWDVQDSPLIGFWIIAGVLEMVAASMGGARPTRTLEWISALLAAGVGLVLVYLVVRYGPLAPAVALWGVGAGIVWAVTGLRLRRHAAAG